MFHNNFVRPIFEGNPWYWNLHRNIPVPKLRGTNIYSYITHKSSVSVMMQFIKNKHLLQIPRVDDPKKIWEKIQEYADDHKKK